MILSNLNHFFFSFLISHRDLYETSKLSNFLSLAIIAIIILGVYKSCIKNRENEPRHDFNSTYAQIINQSDSLTPNEGQLIK
jgi:hypothetical protein